MLKTRKQILRETLEKDVAKYLATGGEIEHLEVRTGGPIKVIGKVTDRTKAYKRGGRPRVDNRQLMRRVRELLASGMSREDAGREVGRSKSWVNHNLRGGDGA